MKKIIILSFLMSSLFSCVDKDYKILEKKLHTTISIKIDTLNTALSEIEKERIKKS